MTKMRWPNFLVIGTPRSGSSWLNALLSSHPGIYLPARRKEIYYFSKNYDRGAGWYSGFFTGATGKHSAVGESTPHYMYHDKVVERIYSATSIRRFIVIMREPSDRLVSHYKHRRAIDNYKGSLADFTQDYPSAVSESYYSLHLDRWLAQFGKDQVLMLVAEEAHADPRQAAASIAAFLELQAADFDVPSPMVNSSVVPRSGRLYSLAHRAGNELRHRDLDHLANWAKRLGVKGVLTRGSHGPRLSIADQRVAAMLRHQFANERKAVEAIVGRSISAWRER